MENPAVSPLVLPIGANPAAPQVTAMGRNLYPRNYMNGYMQQYNLFVEKKVGNWLFSAGYSGSHGSQASGRVSLSMGKTPRSITPPRQVDPVLPLWNKLPCV